MGPWISHSWALPLDFDKSFSWATTTPLQKWLDGPAQNCLPEDAQLVRVDCAKDLGVTYRFRKGSRLEGSRGTYRRGCPKTAGTGQRGAADSAKSSIGPSRHMATDVFMAWSHRSCPQE